MKCLAARLQNDRGPKRERAERRVPLTQLRVDRGRQGAPRQALQQPSTLADRPASSERSSHMLLVEAVARDPRALLQHQIALGVQQRAEVGTRGRNQHRPV